MQRTRSSRQMAAGPTASRTKRNDDARSGRVPVEDDYTPRDNDRFAVDLGARLRQAFGTAERERFLAVKRAVAQTTFGLDTPTRAMSAR
jgi:hypothetical protein